MLAYFAWHWFTLVIYLYFLKLHQKLHSLLNDNTRNLSFQEKAVGLKQPGIILVGYMLPAKGLCLKCQNLFKRQFFSMSRIFDKKRPKPKIYLAKLALIAKPSNGWFSEAYLDC